MDAEFFQVNVGGHLRIKSRGIDGHGVRDDCTRRGIGMAQIGPQPAAVFGGHRVQSKMGAITVEIDCSTRGNRSAERHPRIFKSSLDLKLVQAQNDTRLDQSGLDQLRRIRLTDGGRERDRALGIPNKLPATLLSFCLTTCYKLVGRERVCECEDGVDKRKSRERRRRSLVLQVGSIQSVESCWRRSASCRRY